MHTRSRPSSASTSPNAAVRGIRVTILGLSADGTCSRTFSHSRCLFLDELRVPERDVPRFMKRPATCHQEVHTGVQFLDKFIGGSPATLNEIRHPRQFGRIGARRRLRARGVLRDRYRGSEIVAAPGRRSCAGVSARPFPRIGSRSSAVSAHGLGSGAATPG